MTLATSPVEASVARDELVERWRVALRLRQFQAAEFVDHFVEVGLLERDGDVVRVTDLGERESLKLRGAGDE